MISYLAKSHKGYLRLCGWVFAVGVLGTSCNINRHIMFEEAKGQNLPVPPKEPEQEPVMAIGDIFEFNLFANDGFGVIDQIAGESGLQGSTLGYSTEIQYLVDEDSTANLPVIGRFIVAGKSRSELEKQLVSAYSEFYKEPFVQVRVTNRRVSVFTRGTAEVIPLVNNKTTLLEVLASAGGLDENSHASKIKLIRNEGGVRKAYMVDMSTLEGLKYADIIVQANDYIYVEPVRNSGIKVVREVAPYVSLATSSVVLVISIIALSKN